LEQAYRLESLVAVLALVAVRLLNTKLLARAFPDQTVGPEGASQQLLKLLENKVGKPKGGWTQSTYWIAIARLGGFIGRKSDGMPGWQTIWRGWQRLLWMNEGVETLNQPNPRCG
jgi:hypothetical protein